MTAAGSEATLSHALCESLTQGTLVLTMYSCALALWAVPLLMTLAL